MYVFAWKQVEIFLAGGNYIFYDFLNILCNCKSSII